MNAHVFNVEVYVWKEKQKQTRQSFHDSKNDFVKKTLPPAVNPPPPPIVFVKSTPSLSIGLSVI